MTAPVSVARARRDPRQLAGLTALLRPTPARWNVWSVRRPLLTVSAVEIAALDVAYEARIAEIRDFASKPDHVQWGDGARVEVRPDPNTCGGDPWDGETRGQSKSELRDRALFAAGTLPACHRRDGRRC